MAPAANDRLELAKLCSGRNWSKAIRVLDSILAESSSVQDICNRAFCYSRLELHKHVIKDCDKALQLNPNALQAYILKGNALSALGRKEEALRVWEEGYQNAVCDSTDLKQLLELEELLTGTRESRLFAGEDHSMDASSCETKVVVSEDHIMDSSSTNVSTTETEAIICEDHGSSSVTKVVISEDHVTDSRIKKSSTTNAEHTTNSSGVTPSDKESVDGRRLENTQEICSNPVDGTEIFSMDNDTAKMGRKVVVTGIPRTKSISLDLRLSRGISQVNEGNYDQAVSIFDQILRETPEYPEALIGRGTAYAFQRELDAAIADFTMAIEDLTKALEFEPNSPDVLHERGIVNFKFKDYHSAVDDLSRCIKRAKKNKSAYTYLGLALSAIGEYGQAEEAHLKSLHLDQCFLDAWAHLAQFYLDLTNSEKALHCLEKVLLVNGRFAKAYYLRGLLYHGLGQHRIAIKDLSLGLSIENSNVECLYLRASCYHAIGEYGDAVKDYDAVLDLEHDSMDKFLWLPPVATVLSHFLCAQCSVTELDTDLGILQLSKLVGLLFKDLGTSGTYLIRLFLEQFMLASEEFNSGFGSHTPMLLGQAKVVRYYPNYQRTFDVAKSIIKDIKYVNNAADKIVDLSGSGKLQKIIHAGSCSDMYDVIGENFWVGTTCESTAFEGKHLEGTRITLQRMDKIGFDFAIRTPCTPSRWDEYTEEMATAWEAICSAYTSEMYPSNDLTMLENVKDAILRMTYYWYNFMPLSRGSAVVGYIVLLGLFLAANMEVTGSIPPGVQVDWEAILSPNPDAFLSSIKPWLYPSVRINTAWKDYPDITLAFATTGSIIAALSSYDA
ncbi:Tetratricopeptide repeat protein [Musa troglodytarum]|uniref:Tetratricopeptide repeat protein n=1 Tax=Musa troglodytarum TaxID=320322 RepID=A0A9E7K058_9LILI|nr:Tetratricopeptide repeat protein [Musa troglodytarum]